jgi:hypothetical protein
MTLSAIFLRLPAYVSVLIVSGPVFARKSDVEPLQGSQCDVPRTMLTMPSQIWPSPKQSPITVAAQRVAAGPDTGHEVAAPEDRSAGMPGTGDCPRTQ